ncbi:MAG TPA: Spy/CpxP family protein refolding chaperone [Bryobacteraceae bacterium]|nr:Spy/CpxP family protein refolding chaperone [Bryobacteraceae bacterium]
MKLTSTFAAMLFVGAAAFAQPPAPPPANAPAPAPAPPPARRDGRDGGPPPMRGGAPMAALRGPQGRWWGNPELAQKLGITADQQKKMDDILQQHRLRLVDLHATLDKQELLLEPLVSADQPDETKILAQIDKVAQARAELEKANARMLLEIRRVLTQDQWQKLKAETPAPPRDGGQPGPGRVPRGGR